MFSRLLKWIALFKLEGKENPFEWFISRYRPLKYCKFCESGCYVKTRYRIKGEPVCSCCQDPLCTYDPELRKQYREQQAALASVSP